MYQLHCFAQSGNSFKVAFLLNVLHQPWQAQCVDFMHGATRDPAWRDELNAMGEAPVLDDGALRLTQSGVILTYLAEKHGAFGGGDDEARREVLRWLFFDNHKFTSFFATYRFLKSFGPAAPDPAIMAWLKGRIDAAFAIVEKHLTQHAWLVGDAPTVADISLSAYLFYPPEESGFDLAASHPAIHAWLARLKQIDGWAAPYDVLPGERILPKW